MGADGPAAAQHAVIEQAKATYRAPGCDMPFVDCLASHAERMIRRPLQWHVDERPGGIWTFDVWVGNARNLGDDI